MSNGTPKVTVTVTNDNLERAVNVADGVPGIVGTSYTKIGEAEKVFSLADAVTKGYTLADEPFLHKQIELFYGELGGTGLLWVYGCEETMTISQMVDVNNVNGLKYLANKAKGQITHYWVCFKPSATYAQGNDFLIPDVNDAIIKSKILGQHLQSINRPCRFFLEGKVVSLTGDYTAPNTYSNGYASVAIGGDLPNGHAAGAAALARAVKYPCHVKIGDGQNGPTSISQAYIGGKLIEDFFPAELDQLSDDGFLLLHERDGLAGFYFGVDNTCSLDDFKIMVRGSVIDKAHRIAVSVLVPELETNVRVDDAGLINASDAFYTEQKIEATIRNLMSGQISNVKVVIPTDQNIINSSTEGVNISVLPLGYKTWINVKIGLTSNL